MQITVSARHEASLDPVLRDRAHELVHRLVRFSDQFREATIVFDNSTAAPRVEARLFGVVSGTLVATAEAEDFRSALDQVERKLRRQIERSRRHFSVRRQVIA